MNGERRTTNPYATQRCVGEYLLFHYGQPADLCALPFVPRAVLQFHWRIVEECLLPLRFPAPTRGLDIGCAAGRFAFELGRVVDRVVGLDGSRPLIQAARRMAQAHALTVQVKESGARFRSLTLTLPKPLQKGEVEFKVGDAQNLAASFDQPFHVVAAINVLCRLPRPRQFLSQLHRVVLPGGQLIIASPFSWLEEYTPRREWLDSNEMERLLHPLFRLARRHELPFLIREHQRKYQLVVSEVSVFRRRTD